MGSRLRQALSDTVFGSSVAGDGLLVRLRSTSIAILAAVAIVGLGLVAFISQLGWPAVFSGPIPPGPSLGVVRNDPIVAPRAPAGPRVHASRAARRVAASRARNGGDAVSRVTPASGIAPSRQTGPAPEVPVPPAQPAPAPVTPAPAPTPDAVTTPVADPDPPASDGGATPKPPEPGNDAPVRSSNGNGRGWDDDEDGSGHGHGRGRDGREPRHESPPTEGDGRESESEPSYEDDDPAPDERGSGYDRRHGGGRDWGGH